MVKATKTLNPLPFDALEPKRFEDLIRQLAYDFRRWRMLEATGRSGSDDGYDARGIEIFDPPSQYNLEDDTTPENERIPEVNQDRIWLIQCKREKSISPAKIRKYLLDISADEAKNLYGIIFAAACDFSKKTRNEVFSWCRNHQIAEAHIWGKGEIEDQLFQPKNDHLLFAYFGISLQIRQRSISTALRAKLAIKRKCERILKNSQLVLLIDPTDERYPYIPKNDEESILNPVRWCVREFIEIIPQGITVKAKTHFAYVDNDGISWDAIEKVENQEDAHDPRWRNDNEDDAIREKRQKMRSYWNELSDENRAELIKCSIIAFETILDIDENGDQYASIPHVYINKMKIPESYAYIWRGGTYYHDCIKPLPHNRKQFFPKEFQD